MNASDKSISFLSSQAVFMVPFFQRAYVWDEENWSGIWESLSSSNKNNFLGSLIIKNLGVNKEDKIEYSIIDGQQRITTLSILIKSLIDGLELETKAPEFFNYLQLFLFNIDTKMNVGVPSKKKSIKLQNSRNDLEEYKNVINGVYINDYKTITSTSKIVNAYIFFRKKIDELSVSNNEAINNVISNVSEESRKTLVVITLQNEENEQAIFDTINRAGVRLTSSDIIKNNLFDKLSELMNRDSKEVEKVFDDTWGKQFEKDNSTIDLWLEKRSVGKIERTNLELFLQCFATMNPKIYDPTIPGAKIEDIAECYKTYTSNFSLEEHTNFINELCECSKKYQTYFIDAKSDIINHGIKYVDKTITDEENQIKHILQILGFLGTVTFDPLVLKIINDGIDVKQKLKDLETYIIRDYIFKQNTDKNFNNECPLMIKEPDKYTPKRFIDMKKLTDLSLEHSLNHMYSNDVAKLLLFWVELKKSHDADSDMQNLLVTRKSHQLEHVMPQSPEQYWPISYPTTDEDGNIMSEEEYSRKKEEIDRHRNELIYRLGNMTLLTGKKNNELSNASFDYKKSGFATIKNKWIDGYKTSSKFLISSDIIAATKWDEEEINNRTNNLLSIIKELWPL